MKLGNTLTHHAASLRTGMASSGFVLWLVLFLSMIAAAKNTDLGSFDDSEGKRSIFLGETETELMRLDVHFPQKSFLAIISD